MRRSGRRKRHPHAETVHLLRPADLAEAPTIDAAAPEKLRVALDGRLVLAWFAEVEVAFLRGVFGGATHWRR